MPGSRGPNSEIGGAEQISRGVAGWCELEIQRITVNRESARNLNERESGARCSVSAKKLRSCSWQGVKIFEVWFAKGKIGKSVLSYEEQRYRGSSLLLNPSLQNSKSELGVGV